MVRQREAEEEGTGVGVTAWSDEELAILKRVYPDHGRNAVQEALREAGYYKSLHDISTASQAHRLRRRGYFWSPEEERILRDHLNKKPKQVQCLLADAGYHRSYGGVRRKLERERAAMSDKGPYDPNRPLTDTAVWLILSFTADGFGVDEIAKEINRTPEVIADVLNRHRAANA